MSLTQNTARLALGTLLALIALGSGCSKSTDYGLGQNAGDAFSNPDRDTKVQGLKSDYSTNVVIQDQSYQNEYQVDRVLHYLAENESTLKDKLQNVTEIDIVGEGSSVSWSPVPGGKFAISVNCNSSQHDLDLGFQRFSESAPGSTVLTAAGSRVGLSISDEIGLNVDQANSFSNSLISAAQGYDFTTQSARSYVSGVLIDRHFAMASRGYVIVPFDVGSDDLGSFLGSALDFSKHIDQDLATVSTLLGVSVTYQPGTMMPTEIEAGIRALTNAKDVIRGSSRTLKPIMIGRRSETDVSKVQDSSRPLLIAFNAAVSDVGNTLKLLRNDNTNAVQSAISAAAAQYAQSGITFSAVASNFGVSDMTNDASLAIVQDTLTRLEQAAPADHLISMGINTIQPQSAGSATTVRPNGIAGILEVNLTNLDEGTVASALAIWNTTYVTSNRLATQTSYLSGLASIYPGISIQYSNASFDTSSDQKTLALASAVQTFEHEATPAILTRIGVKTVVFVRGALSESVSVLLSGAKDVLTIDPFKMTPDTLNQTLTQALVQPPVPVVPPSPTPAPAPAPAPDPGE